MKTLRALLTCAALLIFSGVVTMHAQTAPAAPKAGGMDMPAKAASVPSTKVTVTVEGKAMSYTVADLTAMPQRKIMVHNEHAKADEVYTGVAVSDLLAKGGAPNDAAHHRTMLRTYIKAAGTDEYWVLYATREVLDSDHNGDVIVAITQDGKPIAADGQLKLVNTEDKNPARWVKNLSSLTLVEAK